MNNLKNQFTLLLLILSSSILFGQKQLTTNTRSIGEGSSPKANIQDIAWMEGYWQGNAFGGEVEEIWSAPMGNAMMGSFRLVSEGKSSFYEIMTFIEEEHSIMFRLKHFHGDLKGWEEKDETVDFPLIAMNDNRAYFDGITFEKNGKDKLNIYLAMKMKDGSFEEHQFVYSRKR